MLLLFDIDGTLIRNASGDHLAAIVGALEEVYGLEGDSIVSGEGAQIAVAGRTDIEIARELALARGVSGESFQAGRQRLETVSGRRYETLAPDDLGECVVAGMPELLAALADDPRVVLSLVTGNLQAIARTKLARSGLGGFFADGQGGFGSDEEDRRRLPAIARERAGRLRDEGPHPREETILIGDTPLDIACARADDIPCIAVTSGPCGPEELIAADAVAGDVETLGLLIAAILDC